MADATASLRRKIGSATDLQSVVRAMKAQAAASVGQYRQSVAALGAYALSVEAGLGVCFRLDAPALATAPPLRRADRGVVRAVVFGSDQGLVGRFNDIVLDHARAALPGGSRFWAVGERIEASLVDSGTPPLGAFAVPGSVQGIAALVGELLPAVIAEAGAPELTGAAAEVHLFYNRPTSGSSYAPVGQRLLPLDERWRRELALRSWPGTVLPEVLGSQAATLGALIREYLFVSIFRACAESLASENASRLAAMERADLNIDKMLGTLQDRFHHLRQDSIDEELSDVISGFRARGANG